MKGSDENVFLRYRTRITLGTAKFQAISFDKNEVYATETMTRGIYMFKTENTTSQKEEIRRKIDLILDEATYEQLRAMLLAILKMI